jgi:hypothetical protein
LTDISGKIRIEDKGKQNLNIVKEAADRLDDLFSA